MKDIIITIDVEGHRGKDPVEKLIWGKIGNKEYGIPLIMDICDKYGVEALFFVDFAEAWSFGKEKIEEVVKYIVKRGHKVGVHLHPDHMSDKKRLFLWEYTYSEQYDMIKKCTTLYKEILGELPKAFRAGKYGANIDTLDILNELGYIADFSQFYGQKWCGIEPPIAFNAIQKYKNILEIPVTTYESFSFFKFKRYDKIDAVMDFSKYLYVMKEIEKSDKEIIICLFYHSFSMLNWRKDPDNPIFIKKEAEKFEKTIKFAIENREFKFITLNNLILKNMDKNFISETKNSIIKISDKKWISFFYICKLIWQLKNENKKAKLIVFFVESCLILSGAILWKYL